MLAESFPPPPPRVVLVQLDIATQSTPRKTDPVLCHREVTGGARTARGAHSWLLQAAGAEAPTVVRIGRVIAHVRLASNYV